LTVPFDALGGRQMLHERLIKIVNSTRLRRQYAPSLERASYLARRSADEWRWATAAESERTQRRLLRGLVELRLNIDGRGHLFVGRATDTRSTSGRPEIIEHVIAGNFESLLAVMGALYAAAGYHGQVDVGLAVTGIEGAGSALRSQNWMAGDFTHGAAEFRRTARVAAAELQAAHVVAHDRLRDFYEARSGIEGYNPFSRPFGS
jgi:hypothetical protein